MCVVSMVMDHYKDKWGTQPLTPQSPPNAYGGLGWQSTTVAYPPIMPSQADIDEFHKLLARAREYDKRNNEPECELQEKKDALLAIAKALGISISLDVDDDGA